MNAFNATHKVISSEEIVQGHSGGAGRCKERKRNILKYFDFCLLCQEPKQWRNSQVMTRCKMCGDKITFQKTRIRAHSTETHSDRLVSCRVLHCFSRFCITSTRRHKKLVKRNDKYPMWYPFGMSIAGYTFASSNLPNAFKRFPKSLRTQYKSCVSERG